MGSDMSENERLAQRAALDAHVMTVVPELEAAVPGQMREQFNVHPWRVACSCGGLSMGVTDLGALELIRIHYEIEGAIPRSAQTLRT
jgi:hypothetical protein